MPTVLWRSCSGEDLPNLVVPLWPATFACAAVQPDANSCRLCSGAHAQVKTCRTWWCRCGRQLLHAPLFNLTPTRADCGSNVGPVTKPRHLTTTLTLTCPLYLPPCCIALFIYSLLPRHVGCSSEYAIMNDCPGLHPGSIGCPCKFQFNLGPRNLV